MMQGAGLINVADDQLCGGSYHTLDRVENQTVCKLLDMITQTNLLLQLLWLLWLSRGSRPRRCQQHVHLCLLLVQNQLGWLLARVGTIKLRVG